MSPTAEAVAPALETRMISIAELYPSPLNPRKKFTPESLADLTANIQKRGEVIVPLILRSMGGPAFEIVDGERRFRAATAAGNIAALPGIVRDDLNDSDAIEMMLLTSMQRQELTPLEEAGGFKSLIESNTSKYSAAYIADRIGRSEKYVWDTMKLLDLVPAAKALLEREKILVGHARVIAKLKPEDQLRVIAPEGGALFEGLNADLPFDEAAEKNDPYQGLKAVAVAELENWISRHVKFDIKHAAQAAPLDFGQAAEKVEEAAAKPGRGKKVIAITFDGYVQPEAKADGERIFGPRTWKRADGTKGTTVIEYPKRKVLDSPVCDHSVLGVVAVGSEHYGETFEVCIAKERCEIHWKDEIREREKNQNLRDQGKGKQASKNEESAYERQQEHWRKEQEATDRKRAVWQAIVRPLVAEAVNQVKGAKTITPKLAAALEKLEPTIDVADVKKALGAQWWKQLPAALMVSVFTRTPTHWGDFKEFVKYKAKPLGLDIKKLEAVRDQHMPKPKEETAAAKKR
jgi:ParB/RepB/Spo0J family partition protein